MTDTLKENRKLSTPLTDDEKLQLAERITTLNIDIENLMETKKNLPKVIEGKQESAAELSHQYKTSEKITDVECYWKIDDPEPGLKSLYRSDTGELIETANPNLFDAAPIITENDEELAGEMFDKLITEYANNNKTEIACGPDEFYEVLKTKLDPGAAAEIYRLIPAEYVNENGLIVKRSSFTEFRKELARLISTQNVPDPELVLPENE